MTDLYDADWLRHRLHLDDQDDHAFAANVHAMRDSYVAGVPMRYYRGNFLWSTFTVEAALRYGNDLMTEYLER